MTASSGFVGAGVGFRKAHGEGWLSGSGPALAEVIPDHFFASPAKLEALAGRAQLLFHDVGLSLGTEGPLDAVALDRLKRIRELASVKTPLLFSDHLAATRSPSGLDVGHLFPIRFDASTLASIADKLALVQDRLRLPVALENLAAPFRLPGSTMDEADFFWALSERVGCGLLLDLTNLLYDCRNRGLDPRAELVRYPLHAVCQVHLSGGSLSAGVWHDTHADAVHDDSFELLEALALRAEPKFVIIERDQRLPPLSALVIEAREAERCVRRALGRRAHREPVGDPGLANGGSAA